MSWECYTIIPNYPCKATWRHNESFSILFNHVSNVIHRAIPHVFQDNVHKNVDVMSSLHIYRTHKHNRSIQMGDKSHPSSD